MVHVLLKPGLGNFEAGVAARRSYPMPEVKGGSQEEQPHVQRAVTAWVQEGLEDLLHVQGQEGKR